MAFLRVARVVAALVATATSAGCALSAGGSSAPDPDKAVAVVTNIVDGDTIDVDIRGRDERIRLLGIDTPETVHPTQPVECFGPEASAYIAELIPVGTEVRLERDIVPRDNWGRLLAHVFRLDDDLFVNAEMLRAGYAETLTIEPNVAYKREFAALSRAARDQQLGLWGACKPG